MSAWILLLFVASLPTSLVCEPMKNVCSYSKGVVDCSRKGLKRNYGNNSDADWAWEPAMLDAVQADFSRNNMTTVYGFPELQNLTRLDLSHNSIKVIHDCAFQHLQSLVELDLGVNLLNYDRLRPDAFKGEYHAPDFLPLRSLKTLRLRANDFHSLDPDLFEHIANLEELDLSNNDLKLLDPNTVSAITSLGLLKRLDLSFNELSTLPQAFLYTPKNLEGLLLSGNLFLCPPQDLNNTHALKLLALDDNPIVELNSSCSFPSALKELENLSMKHMYNLKRVDAKAMEFLENLKILELSENPKLSAIHGEFPSTLHELYLHENNLSHLEGSQVLGRLDSLKKLDLRANPWECECELQWFLDVVVPIINRTDPRQLEALSCHAPPEMAGKSLVSLELRHYHMRCLDADGNHPERDAAMLTGVLLGLLLGLVVVGCLVALHRRGLLPAWLRCETGPAAFSRGFYSKAGSNNDDF